MKHQHQTTSKKKDKFTNLQKVMKSSATISTRADFNTNSIKTLRIQVNSQILTLHDSHYSSNTVTNLIFFEILEQQEFEIKKIRRSNSLCLFRITDLKDQVFTANQSDINIYSIQEKISDVLTAVIKKTAAKTDAKSKSKSKFLSFCEACKLAESKKKISHQSMQKFKQHDEFLHFNMIDDEKTLENSNDFVSSFSKAKYFILITDNVT